MGGNDLTVCQICKEPVRKLSPWMFVSKAGRADFICPDCIAAGIRQFLPSSFSENFSSFHHSFLFHFKNNDFAAATCLSCRTECEFTVCPYCYTREVHEWLEKINKPLAGQFIKIFSFGFDDQLRPPVGDRPPKEEMGICDECGEYSEELLFLEEGWLCRECGKTI